MQINQKKQYYFQSVEFREANGDLLTLEQVAVVTGTKRKLIEVLIQHELIEVECSGNEPRIHVDVVGRLKKMLRLHYDLGVGWSSMPLVLDLLDRIDELENTIRQLK